MGKLRILLCTPYKQESGYIQGGMVIWGSNIIKYANSQNESEIELIPLSLDRKTFNKTKKNLIRILSGIKELSGAILGIWKKIKSSNYDKVHICTSASLSLLKDLIILLIAKKYSVKCAIHFHFGRIPEILKNGGWEKALINRVIKLSSAVITMDEASYKALKDLGYNNIKYLPNPLSIEIINKINRLKGEHVRIHNRILYVGHVVRTKGVWELVEACANIQGIELYIVGRVTREQEVELRNIAGDNSDNWCHFIGEVSHDQVLHLFHQSGLFVFPSYSEGCPNVILEAMACGCPIAASDVGAIPEILDITGSPCGLCYKPKSVTEIENAIRVLIFDEKQKKIFAEKAELRVISNYSMPIVWKKLVDIWKE